MLFISRQETKKLSWKLKNCNGIHAIVVQMYMTPITTKLTNDNGKMVWHGWYEKMDDIN